MIFVLDILLLDLHVKLLYSFQDGLVLKNFVVFLLAFLLFKPSEINLLYFFPNIIINLLPSQPTQVVTKFKSFPTLGELKQILVF